MQLPKVYEHQKIEPKIRRFWEREKIFKGKIEKGKKPFVVTLPPPNVTGSLHAGHAMYVIEDIYVRYNKLLGKPVLFVPGFDHASIAVEALVANQLWKEEKKSKTEIGRREFLKRARAFAQNSKKYIKHQLKMLGFAFDWDWEAYTMDKTRSLAVKEAFHRLYKEGLVYKDKRVINWCPRCFSALSDLEVNSQEEEGALYYLDYGPVVIATTRPETIFADVAVAVSPKIKKYKKLVGKKAVVPLANREIPIIEDERVDPKFGTGALKITPTHSFLDYEIAKDHNLPTDLVAIDLHGKTTELTARYRGKDRFEAREEIVKDLKKQGLLVKEEKIEHTVGKCYRCKAVVEPALTEQWFVKTKPLAKKAIEVVKKGKVKIIPRRFEKIYFQWLENIQDWCISRQIFWGHKIPLPGEKDTLDTWFSSALWPISVFGWPKKSKALEYYYPTTLRDTGYDIIFFWVAREIMMCTHFTGKPPYKYVYLHGLVRDEKGRKFSKSKGIGFDPLEITPKYGTDAFRVALVIGNPPGNDAKINEEKVRSYRNFSNKIWNAARFILLGTEKGKLYSQPRKLSHKDDKWIRKELKKTARKTKKHLDEWRPDLALSVVYNFFWHTFCDKYIENSKPRKEEAIPVLLSVLKDSLVLLHPFMPYITEYLYQVLPLKGKKKSIFFERWPT